MFSVILFRAMKLLKMFLWFYWAYFGIKGKLGLCIVFVPIKAIQLYGRIYCHEANMPTVLIVFIHNSKTRFVLIMVKILAKAKELKL